MLKGVNLVLVDVVAAGTAAAALALMTKSDAVVEEAAAEGMFLSVKRDLEDGDATTSWSSERVTSRAATFGCSSCGEMHVSC